MGFYFNAKPLLVVLLPFALICLLLAVEILYIKFTGTPIAVPDIPRHPQAIGDGEPIIYVVLGDSTAVGQGGDYAKSITVSSAEFIAKDHRVTYQNFAVSGARLGDVLKNQVPEAVRMKPDIVLIAAGANDVTHLTSLGGIEASVVAAVDKLREANPLVNIVFTGSPAMGSVPRFPQPIKYLAQKRTAAVNNTISKRAGRMNAEFAPIAKETGPIFMQNPQLFAADKFHPNNKGYDTWKPIINRAIVSAFKEGT